MLSLPSAFATLQVYAATSVYSPWSIPLIVAPVSVRVSPLSTPVALLAAIVSVFVVPSYVSVAVSFTVIARAVIVTVPLAVAVS